MRQVHRAGAALEVDYAGMTLMDMGAREAQVFVARNVFRIARACYMSPA